MSASCSLISRRQALTRGGFIKAGGLALGGLVGAGGLAGSGLAATRAAPLSLKGKRVGIASPITRMITSAAPVPSNIQCPKSKATSCTVIIRVCVR